MVKRISNDLLRGIIEISFSNQRRVPKDIAIATPKQYLKEFCTSVIKLPIGSGSLRCIVDISHEYRCYLITFNPELRKQISDSGYHGTVVTVDMMTPIDFTPERDLVLFVDKKSLSKTNFKILDGMIFEALKKFTLAGKMLAIIIMDSVSFNVPISVND